MIWNDKILIWLVLYLFVAVPRFPCQIKIEKLSPYDCDFTLAAYKRPVLCPAHPLFHLHLGKELRKCIRDAEHSAVILWLLAHLFFVIFKTGTVWVSVLRVVVTGDGSSNILLLLIWLLLPVFLSNTHPLLFKLACTIFESPWAYSLCALVYFKSCLFCQAPTDDGLDQCPNCLGFEHLQMVLEHLQIELLQSRLFKYCCIFITVLWLHWEMKLTADMAVEPTRKKKVSAFTMMQQQE